MVTNRPLARRTGRRGRHRPAAVLGAALVVTLLSAAQRLGGQTEPERAPARHGTRAASTVDSNAAEREPADVRDVPDLESPTRTPAVRSRPPEFFNLRYDEDYSYLDESPQGRGSDPWMRLKNIDLGGRWRLDFGGEFRLRVVNRTNPRFGDDEQTSNMQQNYRWLVHANLHYERRFRLFAQGIFAHAESQDGPFEPTQENHGDLQQLFVDFTPLGEAAPLTVRVGRQELNYGHDRMIGAFEWVSTRRRFDAVKAFYRGRNVDVDLWAARPVRVERQGSDNWDDDHNLYGLYVTFRLPAQQALDLYVFHSDRADPVGNPNGHIGGRSVTTAGTRFWGAHNGWDYDIEAAGQWGQWASDSVQAAFFEADIGYQFDYPWSPRVGAGFGWASGDDDPYDRHVGTWDQLFTYNHVCISLQDLVGRQNITRAYLMMEAWPTPRIKTSIVHQLYWLNQDTDHYYDGGGNPVLRDRFGHSGAQLGQALELQLEYQLTAHTRLLAAYSHFWAGGFFHNTVGDDDDPDLFFIQYQYTF